MKNFMNCKIRFSVFYILLLSLLLTLPAKANAKPNRDSDIYSGPWMHQNMIQGRWFSTSAWDIHHDNKYEDTRAFRNIIWLKTDYSSNNATESNNGWYLRVSGRFDRLDAFNSSSHWREYNFRIWDTYLTLEESKWDISVGKLLLRWGKTDQISPVDNINPQDFRTFVLLKREDRKQPVFMLRTRVFIGENTLELVLDPQTRHNIRTFFDTDWAIFDHLKEQYAGVPVIGPVINNLYIDKPSNGPALKNTEVGLRLSGSLSAFDYGASIFFGHNRSIYPYIKSFPIKNIYVSDLNNVRINPYTATITGEDIVVTYPRDTILGLSLESTLGPYGIRGEWAWHTDQVFMQHDLTSTKKNCLMYVLGIDRTWANNFYANVQFIQQWIPYWDSNILFERRLDSGFTFRLSQTFVRGTYKAEIEGTYSVTTRDYYVNPEFSYKPMDNLRLFTGLHIIGGPADTLFHMYDKNDEIYVGFEAFF